VLAVAAFRAAVAAAAPVLVDGNPIGARLHKVAKQQGMLLMGCDQCCYEREIADKLLPACRSAAFPDLYKALSGNMPDQVITLRWNYSGAMCVIAAPSPNQGSQKCLRPFLSLS
jgi:hypothetical protein